MKRVALAGGIGAGKSTVQAMLQRRGLAVLDADDVARELLQPGSSVLSAVVDAFGAAALLPSGEYNRSYMASVVFHDETARRRLNAITHPPVGAALSQFFDEDHGPVAFVALPLLGPQHRSQLALDEIWTVVAEPGVVVKRLTSSRSMSEADALARLKAQPSNAQRVALSDEVLINDGSLVELETQVEALVTKRGWSD